MTMQAHTIFRNTRVFGGLDGLRFLSIFAVFWHHTPFRLGFLPAENYGFLGVDLFFVISGFLIVTLLLREREQQGDISLKSFYIRRSLRIFPLYYGFILALTILYFLFNRESENALKFFSDLPVYLLYLANLFPVGISILWSLASEEQFYLVWPFLEKYLKKYIYYILAFGLAINQLINFQRTAIADWLGLPHFNDLSIMQATFTPILLGVGLAHLLHNKASFDRVKKFLIPNNSSLLWLAILVITCSFLPDDISGLSRLFVQFIMLFLVGSVVINENNKLMPFLKIPLIARIGAISYGVYIFHSTIISVVEKLLHKINIENEFSIFIISYLLTILVAELSYRFFEMPFLKLKSKFSVVHQKHA